MSRRGSGFEGLRERVGALVGAREVELVERLQALWGGYGQLWRVALGDREGSRYAIVKWVDPPAGESGLSHRRKLRSYAVEWAWYRRYAQRCDDTCRVPRCLGQESGRSGSLLVLEDLAESGFQEPRGRLAGSDIEACLAWLARFHARFLGAAPEELWATGTYWHLATRPEEHAILRHDTLKQAAPRLDAALRAARFRTFVHGDAKVENFCFGARGVAAVDFQYVGGGVGVQDVAYFLGSCLALRDWSPRAPAYLESYFQHLRAALSDLGRSADAPAVEREWRALYPVAWADFYRFLLGWAPSEPRDPYSEAQLAAALEYEGSGRSEG